MSAPSGKAGARRDSAKSDAAVNNLPARIPEAVSLQNPWLRLQAGAGNQAVRRILGPGRPIPDDPVNDHLQQTFGTDFSTVRIHTGERAARFASRMGARALTYGTDIVFNSNRYDPGTTEGKYLLAHELAHVVQQSRGGVPPVLDDASQHEHAADAVASQVVAGSRSVQVPGATGVGFACALEDELPVLQGLDIEVEVLLPGPKAAAEIAAVLESEYLMSPEAAMAAQARSRARRGSDYDFSTRAAVERGHAYQSAIQQAVMNRELTHPLLDRERNLKSQRIPALPGGVLEQEMTGGARAKARIMDLGWTGEITIEGQNTGLLGQGKLEQLGRDLQNNGEAVLVVPELTPGMQMQLAKLKQTATAQLETELKLHVLIVNGRPPEPWTSGRTPKIPAGPAPAALDMTAGAKAGSQTAAVARPPRGSVLARGSGDDPALSALGSVQGQKSPLVPIPAMPNPPATRRGTPQVKPTPQARPGPSAAVAGPVENAEVRMRKIEGKLASVARVIGTIMSISGEILNASDALSSGLEAHSMIARGLLSKGRVYTQYFENLLALQRRIADTEIELKDFQGQLVDLPVLVFENAGDKFWIGLIESHVLNWFLDWSRVKEEMQAAAKSINDAIYNLPRQKAAFELILRDPAVTATYALKGASSLEMANILFFLAESDDIKATLGQTAGTLGSILSMLTQEIAFLQAWHQFLTASAKH